MRTHLHNRVAPSSAVFGRSVDESGLGASSLLWRRGNWWRVFPPAVPHAFAPGLGF